MISYLDIEEAGKDPGNHLNPYLNSWLCPSYEQEMTNQMVTPRYKGESIV